MSQELFVPLVVAAAGVTGLLCPEKDVESFGKSIEILYRMGKHEYDEFSVRGGLDVPRAYDIRSNAQKFRQLYHEINSGNQGQEPCAD